MRRVIAGSLVAVFLSVAGTSCAEEDSTSEICESVTPTFSSLNTLIFQPYCATQCHSGGSMLLRTDPGGDYEMDDYNEIVDEDRVVSGSSSSSEVYTFALSGTMPTAPFGNLCAQNVAAIKEWIDGGAADD